MRGMYSVFCVLSLVLSVAYAQNHTCQTYTPATGYTANVCPFPTYLVDTTSVNTTIADDAHSALLQLKDTKTAASFVSPDCITAYLQLSCAQTYPTCDESQSQTVALGACVSLCTSLYSVCNATEISAINAVATVARIPTLTGCSTVYTSPSDACTYASNVTINFDSVVQRCIIATDGTQKSYERFYNLSFFMSFQAYKSNNYFFNTVVAPYKTMLEQLAGSGQLDPNDRVNATCMKPYLYYFNALVTPACPADPPSTYTVAPLPCRSLCTDIVQGCANDDVQGKYGVFLPAEVSLAACRSSLNFADEPNCFYPNDADVYTDFYIQPDGGGSQHSSSDATPTVTPSPASSEYITPDTPQEQWAKGGILGGGLLAAILAVVGGLMLLMKRQDSR